MSETDNSAVSDDSKVSAVRDVPEAPEVLDERMNLGAGFTPTDRQWVLKRLSGLAQHLSGWRFDRLDLEVSVKERGGRDQRVLLEIRIPGGAPLLAQSSDPDLDHALVESRKELIRQLEDARSRRDPSKHRESIKRPS